LCLHQILHNTLQRTLRKNLNPPRDKAPLPNSNFIE
jgi:hypothetical protein